jgi:nitrous oxide reductase accessory protein NosL
MTFGTTRALAGRTMPGVSATTKCPVCGMFVSKYPDWIAGIRFKDASAVYFDGAKDLFTFMFGMSSYAPSKKIADIETIVVQDYYSLAIIDGTKAFYVISSDVFGPMGKELIPFTRKDDAQLFLKDHKGKKIVTFKEITPAFLKSIK